MWAAFDPIARRFARTDYSDRRVVGLPLHVGNGAVFGLVYREVRLRFPVRAVTAALVEHVAVWPLLGVLDRKAVRDPRAFMQSALGHGVFGLVLGLLIGEERKLARSRHRRVRRSSLAFW